MGDGDEVVTATTTDSDRLEVACPCLNIRCVLRRVGDDAGGEARVELDEEGGALRVSHPRLVAEEERSQAASSAALATSPPSSSSSSRDKGKERASDEDGDELPITCLRCLNCSAVLLSYPADSDSSPIAPKSKTGRYTIDLSPSSKLVIGTQNIAQRSDKDKNPDWSDVFRLVIPTSSSAAPAGSASSSAHNDHRGQDNDPTYQPASSSMSRRTPSSDTLQSKKSDDLNDNEGETLATSPALRRTSSLKRTNSGTGSNGRPLSATQSPFHSAARARIKRDRQEMESKIAQMRADFEAESRRYIEQADILASKLRAASKPSKRNASPSAAKSGTTADKGDTSSVESSHVIIRGGFDAPKTEALSPSSSFPSGLGTARSPITSPHIATATNFPALFSSMSGATTSSSPAAGTSSSPAAPKNDGIVQPTKPQSPTMRRSRSPSPSRDTSKGRNESRDRATSSKNAAGGSSMERTASDDQHAGATTSRRPALNLMRDVSNLENKNDHTGEEQRGRSTAQPGTSLPTHSALRKTGYQPNIAASYAPRQRGAWLRLNGVSPSPPVDRLMLDRELPEVEKKEVAEAEEDADAESKRMSLSKHRHVSFKEPEDASSVEASPAPVEQPLEAEGLAPEEDDEVPFDMDEDIEEDEPDGDEEDGSFVAVEMPDQTDGSPQTARSSSLPRQAGIAGSPTKTTASLSEKADKRGDAAASLSALLNDPSSFIGSLKSRNYGIGSLPARSATDYATSPSSSTKDRVSLSDQAQRLRDLLALDAPSHRTTKLKRDKALASYLRDSSAGQDNEKDIADDELDSVAPVSALATSLPVAIGVPGFNKKEAYDFERKTSVPQRESMLVPRLQGNNRHRPSKPGQYSPLDRLPSLGEESESQPTSRAPSPSGVPGPVNTGTGDALAAGNDETDEMADQLRELNGKEDFIPPHVWKFRDKPVRAVDMLGTSIHDYE